MMSPPPEADSATLPAALAQQIVETLPEPIAYIDAERRFRFVNRAHESWFGHRRREVEGQHLREVLGEAAYAAIRPHVESALRGECVAYEWVIPAPDGDLRHIRHTFTPIAAPGGGVTGFFALAQELARGERATPPREGDGRYRELWENAQEILYTLDLEGRLLDANRQIENLTGFPRAELLGRPITDLIVPSFHDPMRHQLGRKLAGEPVTTYEVALRTRDGSKLIVEVSSRLMHDEQGRPVGIQGSARDVTARVALEEELRTSEERLRLAAAVAGFGTYDDRGPGRVYWSPELRELFGLPGDAPPEGARTTLDYVHPDDRARWLATLEAARDPAGTGDMAIEHRIVRPDGSSTWVAQRGRILFEGEGAARRRVRAIGVVTDIAARKKGEEIGERLAAIVASSEDAIIGKTLETIITSWNAAAERMYGYTAAEVIGRPITLLVPPDRPDEVPGLMARIRRGEPITHHETERVRRDGTRLNVALSISPIRDAGGTLIGAATIARDITAQKRAEAEREELLTRERLALAEARAALAVRDEFLASVSHDLRTPLTGIRGMAQLLARQIGRLDAPQVPQMLDRAGAINRAAGTMAAMIDELLDLTRLEAGQPLELRREAVDLVALARARGQEHGRGAPRHTIRVAASAPGPIGHWDPARLERVLDNLLSNAIKYSPGGGEVLVAIRPVAGPEGPWAELAVTDRGIGIPAADLPHIFERFRRGGNVVGQIVGAGLGLAGVRHIVELHGGTIAATSTATAGTTVTVLLPLEAPLADGAGASEG